MRKPRDIDAELKALADKARGLKAMPVWTYPPETWREPTLAYDEGRHGVLRDRIAAALISLDCSRG